MERLAASRTAPFGQVQRASVILALADGTSNAQVGREAGRHVDTVRSWRKRFVAERLAALVDRPRPHGRPRLTPQDRLRIIAAATAEPPGPDTVWTHRLLAERLVLSGVVVSASQVGRILAGADLKPHLVRGWLTRPADPEFHPRRRRLHLVSLLPTKGCGGQRGREDRHHRSVPQAPGPARQPRAAHPRGVRVHPPRHRADHRCAERTRQLDCAIPAGLDIHLVLDNGSSHTSKKTRAWLRAHPHFMVHHTPKHASRLNQIELFFSTLTRRLLRRGQFASRQELSDAIDEFVLAYDEHDAKPYRWTYDGTPLKAA
ncbi:helix-turn-helix domain-containing protein [Streptomyces sp. NPDC002285]